MEESLGWGFLSTVPSPYILKGNIVKVCLKYNQNQQFMNQWDYVLCNFKPEETYIIGYKEKAFISNPLKQAKFINSYSELPNLPLVVMAPSHGRNVKGIIPLSKFEHPEDCIYIFGSDSEIMEEIYAHFKVFIETDTTDDMYSFVAYAVTMHDRRMKLGNS